MKRYLFLALAGTAILQAAVLREIYYQGPMTPANITPTFDKGYVLVYDLDRSVKVYGPDGLPRFTAAPDIPGSTGTGVENAAADSDGSVALAVAFWTPSADRKQHMEGGLVFFDPAGKQVRSVDTGRYLPTQVAYAADHSLWAVGYEEKQAQSERPDYSVLRHYSQAGEEQGAFLPRSSFDPELEPARPLIGMWGLRVSKERIGMQLYRSQGRLTWLETDLSGKELGRWELGPDDEIRTFTDAGAVYSIRNGRVVVLDHAAKSWQPAATTEKGGLLGAVGDTLVFWKSDSNTLRWISLR